MKEDFVTYEQALALKKLGFDLEVYLCYYLDDSIHGISEYDREVEFRNYNSAEYVVSCPTLAQVQKWLYNKYKYYICILPTQLGGKFYWDIIKPEGGSLSWSHDDFNSPEEALLAGINKCLKLLEK